MTQKTRIIDKVTIIGAGLGGLAVAIALKQQGIDVQVYEKAHELRPAGGGLGLLPNGLNSLEAIKPGLVEMLMKAGSEVKTTLFRNHTGEIIRRGTTKYKETYGQPLLSMWWWRLQQVLASLLPAEVINLNHTCVGFEENEQSVKTYFENGKTVESDILIGADG
ncbi:MAG TPA: FAD-dependent monooxygenase, partial [Allocoleopsis sp.]